MLPEISTLPKRNVRFRHWKIQPARAVLLLVHGLGAQSGRWEPLAHAMTNQGLACAAIELKGFGDTPPPAGDIDSFQTYYRDLLTLADYLRESYPRQKIFILGESLGGLLAYVLAAHSPRRFAGQILLSPAFRSILPFPWWVYLRVVYGLLFKPGLQLPLPFTADMLTRDAHWQERLNRDPLEGRSASARLLVGILREQWRANQLWRRVRVPALFLSTTYQEDRLISVIASRATFDRLRLLDKTWIPYEGMLHALSVDLGRETVFRDIGQWIAARLVP